MPIILEEMKLKNDNRNKIINQFVKEGPTPDLFYCPLTNGARTIEFRTEVDKMLLAALNIPSTPYNRQCTSI